MHFGFLWSTATLLTYNILYMAQYWRDKILANVSNKLVNHLSSTFKGKLWFGEWLSLPIFYPSNILPRTVCYNTARRYLPDICAQSGQVYIH